MYCDESSKLELILPRMTTCFNGYETLWEPFTLIHHVPYFGGFKNCVSGDKKFLIRHMISKVHVFKVLCDFIGECSVQ